MSLVRSKQRQSTQQIGADAERRAAWFYRFRLFRILERNWHGGKGEIDLIVRRGRLLVFVEVRSRGKGSLAASYETVDRVKMENVIKTAERYLATVKDDVDVRFDVVAFDVGASSGSRMRHYPDAFRPHADLQRPWLRKGTRYK